jgi:outer membrane protein assembly factor BamD (BamD/ComL family)
VILFLLAFVGLAAPPDEPQDYPLLDRGYQEMYNLQFAEAHRNFHEFEKTHPQNPMGPVSDAAAYLFLEFDRLKILRSDFFAGKTALGASTGKPDPATTHDFEADLEKANQLSEELLKRNPADETALFAVVLRIALHADYAALVQKQYMQSLREIKRAQVDADKLLAKYPDYYDAYLARGVENYLLSQKPAPVRWVLRLTGAETDRQAGINALQVVAKRGHYLKPYAKVLLAIAALRAGSKAEAKSIISELAREFPHNDLFQDELKKLS